MKPKEAFEILRDTPIDIRSAREDDIHSLYATAQNMALDALQKQMWIPCSERLPELGKYVLCMCRGNIQEVMRLTPDGWFHDHNHCYMGGFVIAWMPLPEPYKEGE